MNEYEIIVNIHGFIKESSRKPNEREHWVVGCSLEFLKIYYNKKILTQIDKILQYNILEI